MLRIGNKSWREIPSGTLWASHDSDSTLCGTTPVQRAKVRRNGIRRSLRKMPHWNRSEDWGSGIGTGSSRLAQLSEERTRGNCGARKVLAATGRKISRCAGAARDKGNFVRKHSTRDNAEQETRKGRREKRRWKGPECKTWIKDPGRSRQPLLKIERTSHGFHRKAFGLEFVIEQPRCSAGYGKSGIGHYAGVGPLGIGRTY
jgi:hypothetical protein